MKKWTLLFVALALVAMAAVASAEHGSGAGGLGTDQINGPIEPFAVSQGSGPIEPFEHGGVVTTKAVAEHGLILDRAAA